HSHFEQFLRTAAERLLSKGQLRFLVATAEDQPIAVQFAVADESTWYFYQSGMEPELAELRPGLSVFCYAIRSSIAAGNQVFDMMRGDEPYKLRWRASLRPTQEVRAFSPRISSQVRGGMVKVGSILKSLFSSNSTSPSSST
ncbi:MAG: GNAT family N-acetyltransferase, partial [Planctomycetota bacterium]